MILFEIIFLLFCISFLFSLFSLRSELKKNSKTAQVVDELAKGRVIFHAPTIPEVHQKQQQAGKTNYTATSEAGDR